MKVKDLQKQLSKLDPDLEVICYTEDEVFQNREKAFRLFDIEHVDTVEAERVRLEDNTPYLKIGKSPVSEVIGTLNITSDF